MSKPDQLSAYRAMRLGRCPFCDSSEVEAGRFDTDAAVVWQDVTCADCHAEWQEVYLPAFIEYQDDHGATVQVPFINPAGGST